MNQDYWLRQTDKPLFPDLEWSRPETKAQAGKLLIVGGTGYEFAAPANAYGDALEAGIGSAKVLLPDSMRKTVQQLFPEADFAPSTPSGSFATATLAELMDLAAWADGVLFPGDIGRNSETTALLENFMETYVGQVTLTRDAADLLCQQPSGILQRTDTLLVLSQGQLQKLATSAHFPRAFTSNMDLPKMVDGLYEFTKRFAPYIIVRTNDTMVAAASGQVSTTTLLNKPAVWRARTASEASVWWAQNPTKTLSALTAMVWTNRI